MYSYDKYNFLVESNSQFVLPTLLGFQRERNRRDFHIFF